MGCIPSASLTSGMKDTDMGENKPNNNSNEIQGQVRAQIFQAMFCSPSLPGTDRKANVEEVGAQMKNLKKN